MCIFFIKIEKQLKEIIINTITWRKHTTILQKSKMELVKYNEKYELPPFGFNNMGATCYFNAMLQSLLSCTSFTEELLNNKKIYEKHPVTKRILEAIILAQSESTNGIESISPKIWKEMVVYLCQKRKVSLNEILVGQQCAREGFHCLMDSLDEFNNIQNIFMHRYKTLVRCFDCDKWVSDVDSMYSIFEVQPDLKNEQLAKFKQYDEKSSDEPVKMNEFLSKQTSYVDKDFICPSCKNKGEKYNMHCLVMVPEVLVVLSKKYASGRKLNVFTNFPSQLVFNGKNNKKLLYNAVSQIEHSGGLNGGHYWAISKRNNGWYTLNDNGVTPAKFAPTNNTYIVFYHLV